MTVDQDVVSHEAGHERPAIVPTYDQLAALEDEEYLGLSHAFGVQYQELLTQEGASSEVADGVGDALEPYLRRLEGRSDREVAATLLGGYREAYNQILRDHGTAEKYTDINPSDKDLAKVRSVVWSPLGTPILDIPDSDGVFQERTAGGFSVTFLMDTVGLPPFIVVNSLVGRESEKRGVHETSHTAWAVMEKTGVIPRSEDEDRLIGEKSALDVARDEAVAQQAAEQGAIGHTNVVGYANTEGLPAELIERYQKSTSAYASVMQRVQGIDQADWILGFMSARNWDEFFTHVDRMTRLARSAPHDDLIVPDTTSGSDTLSGWGAV